MPDLIVEILSPSARNSDRGRKLRIYECFGVEFYWLVDPDARTIQPLVLRGGKYVAEPVLKAGDQLGSPLFPDIVLEDVGSIVPND